MFCINRVTLLLLLLFLIYSTTNAQVKQNNLTPLLPVNEQQNISKAENLIEKGRTIETEAEKIKNSGSGDKETAKNEKKYNLKRLEASQFYQKGNYDLFMILKDNIADFWKKNKSGGNIQPDIKNKEDKANELFRKAKSLRKVAEDLTYPDEKLVKILEAETIEKEAIETMVKVLYVYLNNPIAYDILKQQDLKPETEVSQKVVDEKQTETALVITKDSVAPLKKIPVTSFKDTVLTNKPIEKVSVTSQKDSSIILKQVIVSAAKDTTTKTQPTKKIDSQLEEIKEESVSESITNLKSNKDTSSLYNMVSINEDQVDMFNKFLQTEYPKDYENYIIDFQKLDYGNVDSMKNAWYNYLYANEETQATVVSDPSSIKDSIALASTNTKIDKKVTAIPKNAGKNDSSPKMTKTASQVKTTSTTKNKLEPLVPAAGFVFRVQISACRIPLDKQSLQSIYNGEFSIIEMNEEKWYKYAVGEFNTYKKARQLRDKINVPGAFVIAYLNGKRIKILTTMIGRTEYSGMSVPESSNLDELVFKVQISASKVPLQRKYIENIYSGSYVVKEIKEDKWYKYVMIIGNNFKEAKRVVETENIPGAFITADYQGKQIELKEALKILRKSR